MSQQGLLETYSIPGRAGRGVRLGFESLSVVAAIAAGVADFICIADDVAERPDPAIKPENVIADLTGLPELLLRRGDTLLRCNDS